MNLFEYAARLAFRFPSNKGDLTAEQLWQLPLQSKTGFDLDTVAQAVDAQVQAAGKTSFVKTNANPAKAQLEAKLELVKYIIGVKMAEAEAAQQSAAKKAEKEKLTALLADKQDEALKGLSAEEIQRRIDAL